MDLEIIALLAVARAFLPDWQGIGGLPATNDQRTAAAFELFGPPEATSDRDSEELAKLMLLEAEHGAETVLSYSFHGPSDSTCRGLNRIDGEEFLYDGGQALDLGPEDRIERRTSPKIQLTPDRRKIRFRDVTFQHKPQSMNTKGNEQITVVNKKKDAGIYIGRGSVFGNPFIMRSEQDRNLVCDNYQQYFDIEAAKPDSPLSRALNNLLERARNGEPLKLACFCAPKRCHGETIKRWLDERL